jgi:membrane protein DedA with SNARE-associated domain
VEELLRHLLESLHGPTAYLTVFGVLVACGLGVPLPEDISLVTGGYLAHLGKVQLPAMVAVGFVGILCGDSCIYLIGRLVGDQVAVGRGFFARLVNRVITPEKRARVEGLFARHGQKIVMLARFLPGVRAVTYFTAGSARMSFPRFIMFDGLAALASAPLITYLGYRFGEELELVLAKIREGQLAVIGAIAAAVVGYLLFKRWRANVQKRQEEAASPASLPAPVAVAAQSSGAERAPASTSVRVSDATSG